LEVPDKLLAARLEMLVRLPSWSKKLEDAWYKSKGKPSERADEVMKVVEQSNAIWGDYRYPARKVA
jgi:hypothetical protein